MRRTVAPQKAAQSLARQIYTTNWRSGFPRISIVSLMLFIASASFVAAASQVAPQPRDSGAVLSAPVQSTLERKKVFKKAGHQLEAVAKFKVRAKVLSVAKYQKGREAMISPVDLALGWSKMASDVLLSQISVTQSDRFASMRYDPEGDVRVTDIVHNSSNMHMIPASREVSAALHGIKRGQVVQIEGYLVDVRHKDGWRWLTSTSRTDRGNGACEILLVKAVRLVD